MPLIFSGAVGLALAAAVTAQDVCKIGVGVTHRF